MDELEYNTLVQRFIDIADPYVIPTGLTYSWAHRQAADFQRFPRKDGRSSPAGVFSQPVLAASDRLGPGTFSQYGARPKSAHKRRPTKRERMHQARKQE